MNAPICLGPRIFDEIFEIICGGGARLSFPDEDDVAEAERPRPRI